MRIVVVEDNVFLARAITQALGDLGHAVDWFACGAAGAEFLAGTGGDIAVIDVNLPRRSGIEIVREMRARGDTTPVLMLTARDALRDRVAGLDAGADDYVTKPFEMAELCARLRALGRRRGAGGYTPERLGSLHFDRAGRILCGPDGALPLPRRELALFETLFDHAGRVVSKEVLCDRLYGTGSDVEVNAIEILVSRLRRKLLGTDVSIRTIRGLGYLMKVEAAP
jgi:two-component system, OmpR family, response regulator